MRVQEVVRNSITIIHGMHLSSKALKLMAVKLYKEKYCNIVYYGGLCTGLCENTITGFITLTVFVIITIIILIGFHEFHLCGGNK